MSVSYLKKRFNCGAKLIGDVTKSIQEKKPLQMPGRKKIRPVRDDKVLIDLVNSFTRNDGGISDADLSNILGTSRMTINRIRHDLEFSYKPLRSGPGLTELQIERRCVFCNRNQNTDWSHKLFTDESRFSTSPDCPIMWWVKKGDQVYAEKKSSPSPSLSGVGLSGTGRRDWSNVQRF